MSRVTKAVKATLWTIAISGGILIALIALLGIVSLFGAYPILVAILFAVGLVVFIFSIAYANIK